MIKHLTPVCNQSLIVGSMCVWMCACMVAHIKQQRLVYSESMNVVTTCPLLKWVEFYVHMMLAFL